jgi:hypothetical protein
MDLVAKEGEDWIPFSAPGLPKLPDGPSPREFGPFCYSYSVGTVHHFFFEKWWLHTWRIPARTGRFGKRKAKRSR